MRAKMHTRTVQSERFGEVQVHFNSDLSGSAYVQWSKDEDGDLELMHYGAKKIPAAAFQAFVLHEWAYCPCCGQKLRE